ncbi:MAG: phosphoadenylyl-sulfate reductase [Endomicrobiia bacterium]
MNNEYILEKDFESKKAEEIIKWALEKFKDKVALASSFGAEDVVLIDMFVKTAQGLNFGVPRIFTLDTGRLPQETYDLMDEIKEKYKIKIEVYYPDTKLVEEMVSKHGFNLFYKSVEFRKLCCNIRKVEPLNRALKDLSAWICGLRREQSVTRTEIKKVEAWSRGFSPVNDPKGSTPGIGRLRPLNEPKGSTPKGTIPKGSTTENRIFISVNDHKGTTPIKINPLADWTEKQVWDYIKENDVPYNILHDKGYPSIGCEPCTRAIKPGEDIRAGRWWWEEPDKKECGLHCKNA